MHPKNSTFRQLVSLGVLSCIAISGGLAAQAGDVSLFVKTVWIMANFVGQHIR